MKDEEVSAEEIEETTAVQEEENYLEGSPEEDEPSEPEPVVEEKVKVVVPKPEKKHRGQAKRDRDAAAEEERLKTVGPYAAERE